MRISRLVVPVATAAGMSLCAAANAGFAMNSSLASAHASSSLFGVGMDPSNSAGSDFGSFVLLDASFDGSTIFDAFNAATASASVHVSIDEGPGTIVGSGSVGADVDADDASAGFASATSSLTIVFSIGEPMGWTIDAFAGGTHAGAEVSLIAFGGDSAIYSSSLADSPISGLLAPGLYVLQASASASSDLSFFSGLFADASYNFTFQLGPIPAPSAGAAMGGLLLLVARRRR